MSDENKNRLVYRTEDFDVASGGYINPAGAASLANQIAEKFNQYVDHLESEVTRLSRVPDIITSFSEGKRLVCMLKDSNEKLREQHRQTKAFIKETLEVLRTLDDTLPITMKGERQKIWNIVSNAIRRGYDD